MSYDAVARTLTTTSPLGRAVVSTLDARGRVVERAGGGLPTAFTYDIEGRLTRTTRGTHTSFRTHGGFFAQAADLTIARDATHGLPTAPAPGVITDAYSYDDPDEVVSSSDAEWDDADQMRHVDTGSGTGQHAYFAYDATGERVLKVYEDNGCRHFEEHHPFGPSGYHSWDSAAEVSPKRYRYTGKVRDEETGLGYHGARYYCPWLGRWTAADPAGLVDGPNLFEEYHPFGTSSYRSFQSSEVSAKRYRYTGKERDEETGLAYHGARYYCPWLGRWTSADPAGLVDGPNLYGYCRGDPIGGSDPTGLGESAFDEAVRTGATYGPVMPQDPEASAKPATPAMPGRCYVDFRPDDPPPTEAGEPLGADPKDWHGPSAEQGPGDPAEQAWLRGVRIRALRENAEVPQDQAATPALTGQEGASQGYADPALRDKELETWNKFWALPVEARPEKTDDPLTAATSLALEVGAASILARFWTAARAGAAASRATVAGRPVAEAAGAAMDKSALRRASDAAFKAASRADEFTVGTKHIAASGGRWAQFAEGTNPNALLREALSSPGAHFLPNDATSFRVVTDLGRGIGTKGQTGIRAVVDFNGHVVTWFPVNP